MTVVERFQLSPVHSISRVIKGNWQLAGGHGFVAREAALADMQAYVAAGITTFDCADIYTGTEELIGEFLHRHRETMAPGELPAVQVHTKFVPDLDSLATLRRDDVESMIDRSRSRLGVERIDLVQFHWWDFGIPGYVQTACHLQVLQEKGKIKHIGVTNFDVAHLKEVCEAGVQVVSNQVQYSLLDSRPEHGMVDFCRRHDIALLCYGTVAGGFLSERYLGKAEPQPPYENRSLTKYKLIIDDFGGWALFQELLGALKIVAERHRASMAAVATRYVLQKDRVGAAIVGARHARHLPDTVSVFDLSLDSDDLDLIGRVTARSDGPVGPVYGVERIKGGKHAAIMKYNLSKS